MESPHLTIQLNSYAKINLSLAVLGRRHDGFHDIESIMQSISLNDTITLSLDEDEESEIRISCNDPAIPTDERNLVWKAATLLFQCWGISPGLDINIEKRIPSEAGLGGGSSNAATVLCGLNNLMKISVDDYRLFDLATEIGSDVPFFLTGGTALVHGRGEEIHHLPNVRPFWLSIIKPPFGISTAWAYKRLDEIRKASPDLQATSSKRMIECIERDGGKDLAKLLVNDLEAPVLQERPEISNIKSELLHAGAQGALMSGSGSAVFGIFETEDEALAASRALSSRGQTFTATTIEQGFFAYE